jgi:hypothetical protein
MGLEVLVAIRHLLEYVEIFELRNSLYPETKFKE